MTPADSPVPTGIPGFGDFLHEHASPPPGLRYFVRVGATTRGDRGFRSLDAADAFLVRAIAAHGLDWRVGWLVRLRGLEVDVEIVDRKGARPTAPR